jgi:lipooligosaccharide transport system permease protein
MSDSAHAISIELDFRTPTRAQRVFSVWHRHYRVYTRSFFANATPAVFEPIFFMLAIGIGLGRYIGVTFLGLDYGAYMAPGILAMTSIYTASFETTYNTYVRMQYQRTYDSMLATPLTVHDVFWGEVLWCATKGFFFSFIVALVLLAFGKLLTVWAVLIPVVGFATGMAFGGLSLLVTSLVSNMNQFQFYFTLFLTPLIFFSGLTFPVNTLPAPLDTIAYCLPMFHVIESFRVVTSGTQHMTASLWIVLSPAVLLVMAAGFSWIGIWRIGHRVQP